MKLKVLDLFSGIGGFSLGLERAGMETVAFCEVDKHCKDVLLKHWPQIPCFSDVKKLTSKQLEPFGRINVICGGFPCQDISIAGKKKGIKKGTRSGLWKEYKRLIGEIKPDYAIIENVGNLRHTGLAQVLSDLWSLGYDAEWSVISAKSVGAWHERQRVWIVAFPNGHDFRLGVEAFAPKKEKQKWWSETTSTIRSWWPAEPSFCGTVNGLSRAMEQRRKRRIKQLGNAVVPQIPQLLGKLIIEHEMARTGYDPNQTNLLET